MKYGINLYYRGAFGVGLRVEGKIGIHQSIDRIERSVHGDRGGERLQVDQDKRESRSRELADD